MANAGASSEHRLPPTLPGELLREEIMPAAKLIQQAMAEGPQGAYQFSELIRLPAAPLPGVNKQQYAVSSDGQRFLVNLAADEGAASPITLIYNWRPHAAK